MFLRKYFLSECALVVNAVHFLSRFIFKTEPLESVDFFLSMLEWVSDWEKDLIFELHSLCWKGSTLRAFLNICSDWQGLPGPPDPKSPLPDRQDLRPLPLERAGTAPCSYRHAVGEVKILKAGFTFCSAQRCFSRTTGSVWDTTSKAAWQEGSAN